MAILSLRVTTPRFIQLSIWEIQDLWVTDGLLNHIWIWIFIIEQSSKKLTGPHYSDTIVHTISLPLSEGEDGKNTVVHSQQHTHLAEQG